ncbi:MAG: hypothetical protein ACOC4M_12115 [Promethearchaeia archaeon]
MKANSSEEKERKEKRNKLSEQFPEVHQKLKMVDLEKLTSQEIDDLSPQDLDYLNQRYQIKHPRPTIIGKKPYDSFLSGIKGENWMSTGDKIRED